MPHLLIFTPTTPGGLRFATLQSVVSQRFTGEIRWEIGRCNPYLGVICGTSWHSTACKRAVSERAV
jgi:hypothetical protein